MADVIGAAMSEDVKYKVNGDNSVLRSVLYDLWGGRCYWCGRPKQYGDVDIDHIVPRTIGADRLKELTAELLLSEDFDVHDPLNLALICRTCNGPGDKGSHDFSQFPRVLTRLRSAQKLRGKVITRVARFADAGAVASALLRAKEADLSDPKARQALEEHAPGLVQALALLGEEKVEYTTYRSVDVGLADDMLEVEVSLDASARRATTILEGACGGTVEAVLQEPVADLYRQIHADTQNAFEGIEVPAGQTYSGPPVSHYMRIDVNSIALDRTRTHFEFRFDGGFEASLSASLMQDSPDGGDLEDHQGEAYVTGRFSFTATWDAANDEEGDVYPGEPWIEEWEQEVWVEP